MRDNKGLSLSCKRRTQTGSPLQKSSCRQPFPSPVERGCAVLRLRQLFQAGNGAEHVLPLSPAPLCEKVLGQVWASSGLCYLDTVWINRLNLIPPLPSGPCTFC